MISVFVFSLNIKLRVFVSSGREYDRRYCWVFSCWTPWKKLLLCWGIVESLLDSFWIVDPFPRYIWIGIRFPTTHIYHTKYCLECGLLLYVFNIFLNMLENILEMFFVCMRCPPPRVTLAFVFFRECWRKPQRNRIGYCFC